MRFQCGKCEKMYKIDFAHVCLKDLSFKCEQCANKFLIKKDLTFSSTSRNSKIICENCGNFIDEEQQSCKSCNLIINKPHEDLKIDNYFYELYQVNEKGKLYDKNTGKIIGGGRLKTPAIFACFLISLIFAISLFYFFSDNTTALNNPISSALEALLPDNETRKETQVVLMKSGKTYYVKKVEKDGLYLKLINNNGTRIDVPEKDVLQISKAIIEKQ